MAGGAHEVVESGTTVKHKTTIGGTVVVIETTSAPIASETIYLLKDHLAPDRFCPFAGWAKATFEARQLIVFRGAYPYRGGLKHP